MDAMIEAPACERCGSKDVKIRRYIISNGDTQFRWQCQKCGRCAEKTGQNISHTLIRHLAEHYGITISDIPIAVDYSQDVVCTICGKKGAEVHHWAPQALKDRFGDEWTRWPTAHLCRAHHQHYRQRILWVGLITTADDQGRGHAHPGIVRGAIFPYDEITLDELQSDMNALAELNLIAVYSGSDGQPLYQIVNWWRYQHPTWAWPSDLPAPEGWTDREKYRKGNEVIENAWDTEGGFTQNDSDPTMTPQRGHDDPTVNKAPSGSSSYRDRDSSSCSSEANDCNPFSLYENATASTLTAILADRIGDLIDECEDHRKRLPSEAKGADLTGEEWVCAGIREASESTNRFGIRYVGAILDRWRKEGFDAKVHSSKEEDSKPKTRIVRPIMPDGTMPEIEVTA